MILVAEHSGDFHDHNFTYDLGENRHLNVRVTSEGIILDYYKDDQLYATEGMTADEWVDWILSGNNVAKKVNLYKVNFELRVAGSSENDAVNEAIQLLASSIDDDDIQAYITVTSDEAGYYHAHKDNPDEWDEPETRPEFNLTPAREEVIDRLSKEASVIEADPSRVPESPQKIGVEDFRPGYLFSQRNF